MVRSKVRCNFMVHGVRVDYHDSFNGKETWYLYPGQASQGCPPVA